MSKNLHEYKRKSSMHNYIDSEVRAFARMHEMDADETWKLRVTTLARMLAGVMNERESNSAGFKIEVDPTEGWNERLVNLIRERTRTLSQEEFMERLES